MTAATSTPVIDAVAVRRVPAAVTERLRALELPIEAWPLRVVALAGLRALSTALFTDARAETGNPGVLATLVGDEAGHIAELTATSETQVQAAAVAVGRWTR